MTQRLPRRVSRVVNEVNANVPDLARQGARRVSPFPYYLLPIFTDWRNLMAIRSIACAAARCFCGSIGWPAIVVLAVALSAVVGCGISRSSQAPCEPTNVEAEKDPSIKWKSVTRKADIMSKLEKGDAP